jgi:hypothetical protein
VQTTPEELQLFGQSLTSSDQVVLEATGNTLAIARILEPHVAKVMLAKPEPARPGVDVVGQTRSLVEGAQLASRELCGAKVAV